MKNTRNILNCLGAALCLMLATGCSEQKIPTYSGENYLYFTYLADRSEYSEVFNFAELKPLDDHMQVDIPITLLGHMLGQDLEYKVKVVADGTTGVVGEDFEEVTGGVFAKDKTEDILTVAVRRDAELLKTNFKVKFELVGSKGYLVGPTQYAYATIEITDKVTEPSWWSSGIASPLGDYYDIKYRLFIIFMDGEILPNLDGYGGIEFADLVARFKAWWIARWAEGKYRYYLPDGVTPMYESITG